MTYLFKNKNNFSFSKLFFPRIAIGCAFAVLPIFFSGCGSDSNQLDSRLVGFYTEINSPNGNRNTLEIKQDGTFVYHGLGEGFSGGTSVKEHYVKGTFQFGEIKKSTVAGFTDEYKQFITGFEYSSDHKGNDGNLLFDQVKWGPEYNTSIGYTRKGATGDAPKKTLLLISEYGISPLFLKNDN